MAHDGYSDLGACVLLQPLQMARTCKFPVCSRYLLVKSMNIWRTSASLACYTLTFCFKGVRTLPVEPYWYVNSELNHSGKAWQQDTESHGGYILINIDQVFVIPYRLKPHESIDLVPRVSGVLMPSHDHSTDDIISKVAGPVSETQNRA
jgi:hypothetical protein